MKSLYISIVLSLSLLLSGCGSRAEEEKFQNFSRDLNEKESLSFISELQCEYEDRTLKFILSFEGNRDGCSVTVAEPKIISGIRANLRPGDTELQFEDMVLDTGNLDAAGLSPMSSLPLLMKAMSQGYVKSCWTEEDYNIYELAAGENCSVTVRFRAGDMIPVGAEIASGGKVKVFCKIGNWL